MRRRNERTGIAILPVTFLMTLSGLILDLPSRQAFCGHVFVEGGRIARVVPDDSVEPSQTILPGFVDAHVHVESSLLVPSEFARMAVVHGTVATVSDPHEIANVCGIDGIRFMLNNAAAVPFTFAFGAPSCVPATPFETAGAEITADHINELLADPRIHYLSEMMNWPGVLHNDPVVLEKLAIAHKHGKSIDGHAPGLKGAQAAAYARHGITTDHECFTLQEALDKIAVGMKILIREGSAARNFDALHPLLGSHPNSVMFCCDDAHPDMLLTGHINRHVLCALNLGYEMFDVLCAASLNPIRHYGLDVGLLQPGDSADFIVVDNLQDLNVLQTFIKGTLVAESSSSNIQSVATTSINNFHRAPVTLEDVSIATPPIARVIVAHDGQLVTTEEHLPPLDPDVLKLCVVNRYREAPVSVGYVKGFGLQRGALASSVAHDSHNIVACGVDDASIVQAINAVIAERGGLSVAADGMVHVLPLPVAGLMSADDAWRVAAKYTELDARAKFLGSPLRAPFMTLSFMALLVIPQLKLSDKGLFDGLSFQFVSVDASVEADTTTHSQELN